MKTYQTVPGHKGDVGGHFEVWTDLGEIPAEMWEGPLRQTVPLTGESVRHTVVVIRHVDTGLVSWMHLHSWGFMRTVLGLEEIPQPAREPRYRMVMAGEVILATDEVCDEFGQWHRVYQSGVGSKWKPIWRVLRRERNREEERPGVPGFATFLLLEPGDIIQEGDQFHRHGRDWPEVDPAMVGDAWKPEWKPVRRLLTLPDDAAQTTT